MKLNDLLKDAPSARLSRGSSDVDVGRIAQDSRDQLTGAIFVALRGTKVDAHNLLESVCAAGPVAVAVEDLSKVPKTFSGAVVETENARRLLDYFARGFWGAPDRQLLCVAVTGTNGKTTTANIVEHLLNA
ncbi:MAG: hypothetical protein ABL958_00935, partial [Bdellovibrionia bacterium]